MLSSQSLLAQTATPTAECYHAACIVLDDGTGNTVTLLPPGGTPGAGSISWPTSNAVGVLTNDGNGGLSWGAAGGPSILITPVGTTTSFTPTAGYTVYEYTGAPSGTVTVTLPTTGVTPGAVIIVIDKLTSGGLTVSTIANSHPAFFPNAAFSYVWDGTDWFFVGYGSVA